MPGRGTVPQNRSCASSGCHKRPRTSRFGRQIKCQDNIVLDNSAEAGRGGSKKSKKDKVIVNFAFFALFVSLAFISQRLIFHVMSTVMPLRASGGRSRELRSYHTSSG
jgi:hypothetical protein